MELLDAGRVVGTHGVRGELRLECWCDSPSFLQGIKHLYLDGTPWKVTAARPHKHLLLVGLQGIDTVEAAMALRGRILRFDKEEIPLPAGRYYVEDLLGCTVVEESGGQSVGVLRDVLRLPAQDVYVVQGDGGERMIPAVPEFVRRIDLQEKTVFVHLIEGM